MRMLGLYFSGTGNTKHCVEVFVKQWEENSVAVSIESPSVFREIEQHDTLVLGYPIQFSNIPKIVQDFIRKNQKCFARKKIFLLATMGLFSGDGTGCAARLLKKSGAEIIGGLHLKMPDCIGDEKLLKKPEAEKRKIIRQAEEKITLGVQRLKAGKPTTEGLHFLSHMAGLFGQRLWFYQKTASYQKKPNVRKEKCIGCGRCEALCPMKNITIEKEKAVSHSRCTLCYRCVSHCPTQALTILGKKVYEQYLFQNHI